MLGRHIKNLVDRSHHSTESYKWIFTDRRECDLSRLEQVDRLFKVHMPTVVLHCAAFCGSLKKMSENPVEYWTRNITVNDNVLRKAFESSAWCGKIKVISVLSTVMLPYQGVKYPVDASDVLNGHPHPSAESYGYAKRMLLKLCEWYRREYDQPYYTVLPGNVYGEWGDFNPATAPLVNALVAKATNAVSMEFSNSGRITLPVMGTGRPLRQVIYAGDLARIMIWAIDSLKSPAPLLLTSPSECSIRAIAETVAKSVVSIYGTKDCEVQLEFDENAPDGDLRRTIDLSDFHAQLPEFEFTSLEDGILNCARYYRALKQL